MASRNATLCRSSPLKYVGCRLRSGANDMLVAPGALATEVLPAKAYSNSMAHLDGPQSDRQRDLRVGAVDCDHRRKRGRAAFDARRRRDAREDAGDDARGR